MEASSLAISIRDMLQCVLTPRWKAAAAGGISASSPPLSEQPARNSRNLVTADGDAVADVFRFQAEKCLASGVLGGLDDEVEEDDGRRWWWLAAGDEGTEADEAL